MFLASIEGNLIGLIIFAVIGVINWLAQKKQDAQAHRPPASAREIPPSAREEKVRDAGDEQERLPKFMEALGLPPNDSPPQPRSSTKRPPIMARRPEPPRLTRIERERGRMPRAPRATPPRLPARQELSLDEAGAPSLPVESLFLPPLVTRPLPEFDTLSSHISAIPQEMAAARAERDAYEEPAPARAARVNPLAELLRSRGDLRRAILLREVLGAPRGLPDSEPLRSFR